MWNNRIYKSEEKRMNLIDKYLGEEKECPEGQKY
jgi:hypothetical protein